MLLQFTSVLKNAQQKQQPLLQIKVVETEGSSYRKTGARMLIDETGTQFDLVSGGCLETHLSRHAAKVFRHGKPTLLTYDFADVNAPDWQVSLGCKGKVVLLLEKLSTSNHYSGLSLYLEGRQAQKPSWLRTNLHNSFSSLHWQLPQHCQDHIIEPITPAPKLLIIGTGADTDAVIHLAQSLDFSVQIIGCQSQSLHAFQHRFPIVANPVLAEMVTPKQLDAYLHEHPQDYVLLMTHNQDLDADYLNQHSIHKPSIVGLLGPESRKQNVLSKLSRSIPANLVAPIGLDLGGHGTHAVALSVMAQLQTHYHQMSTMPLCDKQRGIHDSSQ